MSEVKDMSGNIVPEKQEVPMIKIPLEEVNMFNNVLGIMLIGDDRLKGLQKHFIDMIKRNNNGITKQ